MELYNKKLNKIRGKRFTATLNIQKFKAALNSPHSFKLCNKMNLDMLTTKEGKCTINIKACI